jgi:site-specific recombinase XerD
MQPALTPFPLPRQPVNQDRVEEEFAKDIWDVRFIPGARYPAHRSEYRLNFTGIPDPFRALIKRYLRFLITQRSQQWCARTIRWLELFVHFFLTTYPDACDFQPLSRADVEAYLVYLHRFKGVPYRQGMRMSDEAFWRTVTGLRKFLEYLEQTSSAEAPLKAVGKLIWLSDSGAVPLPQYNPSIIKYIPEMVLAQLEANIHHLPPTHVPVVLLLRASGWRISDVLTLRHSTCLEHSESGWWLCGDIAKTNILHHRVPISDEIATLVTAQIALAKEQYSDAENPEHYLFPSKSKNRRGRPMGYDWIRRGLDKLTINGNIRDEVGNLFYIKTHAFRHTKAVELINNGMSLLHVQQWLAHLTPEMTLIYAKILDSTMRKEWEQAFAQGAVRIDVQGQPKAVNTEQLRTEQEIEWEHIRHNLDAVRLPNGYCFKPKKAHCPPQETPCYTCHHFCTTPDFLLQFEREERDLRELIALGEKAGSEIWIERNTQKLQRVLPVIQILKQGNLHHPAGKAMREYTPEERAKHER